MMRLLTALIPGLGHRFVFLLDGLYMLKTSYVLKRLNLPTATVRLCPR
jgi:hypothetical protein